MKKTVFRSIEAPGGVFCVDIFRNPDGDWGYACYRRDPEDGRGWYADGPMQAGLAGEAEALAAAVRDVPWLADQL